MLEERPVGSLELSECLAEDPFGKVYRGLEWVAPRKIREVMVRQYHPIWLERGLSGRQHEIMRNLVHLGHLKPFKGCHASRDGSTQLVWPYASGRNLAQVLRAAESQGMPFGIDQALFLVWALSHHIRHLRQVQLSPGILTPYRLWIGFDGWVQLLDVPVMEILQELLPSAPEVQGAMHAFVHRPSRGGLDFDAFQLGALLFEMLTNRPLPEGLALASILEEARIGMPGMIQEPFPEAIQDLLRRLLGCSEPFITLEELERTMEDSVFGGEFDPSTFGLAFTMQTIFRHEIAASAMSLSHGASDPGHIALSEGAKLDPGTVRSHDSRFRRFGLLAGAFLVGGMAVWFGVQTFTRGGTVASTPEQPRVLAVSSVANPLPAMPPTPVAPATSPSASAISTGLETEKRSQLIFSEDLLSSAHPAEPMAVPKPVKLRVFVDEAGRVRQVHVISGATEGSEREQAACAAVMLRKFSPQQSAGQNLRSWEEVTVMVP